MMKEQPVPYDRGQQLLNNERSYPFGNSFQSFTEQKFYWAPTICQPGLCVRHVKINSDVYGKWLSSLFSFSYFLEGKTGTGGQGGCRRWNAKEGDQSVTASAFSGLGLGEFGPPRAYIPFAKCPIFWWGITSFSLHSPVELSPGLTPRSWGWCEGPELGARIACSLPRLGLLSWRVGLCAFPAPSWHLQPLWVMPAWRPESYLRALLLQAWSTDQQDWHCLERVRSAEPPGCLALVRICLLTRPLGTPGLVWAGECPCAPSPTLLPLHL